MQSSLNWIEIKRVWHLSNVLRSVASPCLISLKVIYLLIIQKKKNRAQRSNASKKKNPNLLKRHCSSYWFLNKTVFTQSKLILSLLSILAASSGANIRAFEIRFARPFSSEAKILPRKLPFLKNICPNRQENFLQLIDDVKTKRSWIFHQFKQLNPSG